ncbi:GNAT family N-acetyltransferase [Sulfobacillus harzensis]|uniref:GNAT family N-acetyltransferase n=1 Tax=Sulfobacillus harzensis TaxID=2729629 RepID=A0A7Y0L2L1_9FIRM|nr:GNAT family N-acetyltransferase [Sulfobacillus harzensis]NMP22131.1 GNAT family N-acetyltransferase [Sulfobacillus harzensis]
MVEIRRISDPDGLVGVSRLEAEIWGASDPTPVALLTVFSHRGGVVLGAFHDQTLVGVVVGFPAIDEAGRLYLHSHLLGVLPTYRRQRLGERLKRAQWDFAQNHGFSYIGWTYDPLLAANAWFNLAVLGSRVAGLQANVYGELGDRLNGSLPTHRFWVAWNPAWSGGTGDQAPATRVAIPENVAQLRERDPDQARIQADDFFRQAETLWESGLRVVGVEKQGEQVNYLWQEGGRRGEN